MAAWRRSIARMSRTSTAKWRSRRCLNSFYTIQTSFRALLRKRKSSHGWNITIFCQCRTLAKSDNVPFIVMRLMPHGQLHDRLNAAPAPGLPLPDTVRFAGQIAPGRSTLHTRAG